MLTVNVIKANCCCQAKKNQHVYTIRRIWHSISNLKVIKVWPNIRWCFQCCSILPICTMQRASKRRTVLHITLLFAAQLSVRLAWKSATKSNEKLINQKYAKLFLSWMPFSTSFFSYQCNFFRFFNFFGRKRKWDGFLGRQSLSFLS